MIWVKKERVSFIYHHNKTLPFNLYCQALSCYSTIQLFTFPLLSGWAKSARSKVGLNYQLFLTCKQCAHIATIAALVFSSVFRCSIRCFCNDSFHVNYLNRLVLAIVGGDAFCEAAPIKSSNQASNLNSSQLLILLLARLTGSLQQPLSTGQLCWVAPSTYLKEASTHSKTNSASTNIVIAAFFCLLWERTDDLIGLIFCFISSFRRNNFAPLR